MHDLRALLSAHDERQKYNWELHARPNQRPPVEDFTYWLILAGRGFGKTRVGAEMVRKWVRSYKYVNLIGPTADDVRSVQVEGESGILAVCPKDERPIYHPSKRNLEWPNGAVTLLFSADEPERLRGKQHMKLWADELCSWRAPDSWDQAKFGLRLGDSPQCVVTTTPKPTKLLKDLMEHPGTITTRGSTYDNRANLAPSFFATVIRQYENTRLGRQELNAEVLEDVQGALWSSAMLEALRVRTAPEMSRIVVAIDPAVTAGENADETGIIVVGRGADGHAYVIQDLSCRASADVWGRRAVDAYKRHGADRLVAEVNQGGDLVERVIRTVDTNVAFRSVRATRGKAVRAEPIAALYEQGRVHHVGLFAELEEQMCAFVPGALEGSPDRADALVWAITELALSEGHLGFIDYLKEMKERDSAPKSEETMKDNAPVESSAPMTCPRCSGTVGKLCGDQGWRCPACGWQGGNTVKFAPARRTAATDYMAQWREIGRRR